MTASHAPSLRAHCAPRASNDQCARGRKRPPGQWELRLQLCGTRCESPCYVEAAARRGPAAEPTSNAFIPARGAAMTRGRNLGTIGLFVGAGLLLFVAACKNDSTGGN